MGRKQPKGTPRSSVSSATSGSEMSLVGGAAGHSRFKAMKKAPAGMNSRTTLMPKPGTLARNYVKVVAKQPDDTLEEEEGGGGEEQDGRGGGAGQDGPTLMISGLRRTEGYEVLDRRPKVDKGLPPPQGQGQRHPPQRQPPERLLLRANSPEKSTQIQFASTRLSRGAEAKEKSLDECGYVYESPTGSALIDDRAISKRPQMEHRPQIDGRPQMNARPQIDGRPQNVGHPNVDGRPQAEGLTKVSASDNSRSRSKEKKSRLIRSENLPEEVVESHCSPNDCPAAKTGVEYKYKVGGRLVEILKLNSAEQDCPNDPSDHSGNRSTDATANQKSNHPTSHSANQSNYQKANQQPASKPYVASASPRIESKTLVKNKARSKSKEDGNRSDVYEGVSNVANSDKTIPMKSSSNASHGKPPPPSPPTGHIYVKESSSTSKPSSKRNHFLDPNLHQHHHQQHHHQHQGSSASSASCSSTTSFTRAFDESSADDRHGSANHLVRTKTNQQQQQNSTPSNTHKIDKTSDGKQEHRKTKTEPSLVGSLLSVSTEQPTDSSAISSSSNSTPETQRKNKSHQKNVSQNGDDYSSENNEVRVKDLWKEIILALVCFPFGFVELMQKYSVLKNKNQKKRKGCMDRVVAFFSILMTLGFWVCLLTLVVLALMKGEESAGMKRQKNIEAEYNALRQEEWKKMWKSQEQKYGVLFPPDETLLQKAADKFNEESSWVTVGSTGFTGSRGPTGVTVSTTKERKEEEEKEEEKTTTLASSTASTTASTTATTVAETTPLWKILTTRWWTKAPSTPPLGHPEMPWEHYDICKGGGDAGSCSGRGVCAQGKCVCDEGWTSYDCSVPTEGWGFDVPLYSATHFCRLGVDCSLGMCIGGGNSIYPNWNLKQALPDCKDKRYPGCKITGIAAVNPSAFGARQATGWVSNWGGGGCRTPTGACTPAGPACGQCFRLHYMGRFVDVVVVDRCGGYMRASDDKTCDPNGKRFAEGGNCIKDIGEGRGIKTPPISSCHDPKWKQWNSGGYSHAPFALCDWCAGNINTHFDLDDDSFKFLYGQLPGIITELNYVVPIECGPIEGTLPEGAWPFGFSPVYSNVPGSTAKEEGK